MAEESKDMKLIATGQTAKRRLDEIVSLYAIIATADKRNLGDELLELLGHEVRRTNLLGKINGVRDSLERVRAALDTMY